MTQEETAHAKNEALRRDAAFEIIRKAFNELPQQFSSIQITRLAREKGLLEHYTYNPSYVYCFLVLHATRPLKLPGKGKRKFWVKTGTTLDKPISSTNLISENVKAIDLLKKSGYRVLRPEEKIDVGDAANGTSIISFRLPTPTKEALVLSAKGKSQTISEFVLGELESRKADPVEFTESEAVSLLKEKGYRILQPVKEWKEL